MSRRNAPYSLPRTHQVRPPKHVSVYTGGRRRWQDRVFTFLLIAIAVLLLVAGASIAGIIFARQVAAPHHPVTKRPGKSTHHTQGPVLAIAVPRLPATHARVA